MSKETIYNALINAGMTATGACAMLGNMQAESAMRANNAQDGMTSLTDESYTSGVDNGSIGFIYDAIGYGLCQWTFWSRKQALLNYAKSKGVSIGDEVMQVGFCVNELKQDFRTLFNYLCSTDDLYTATSRICTEYERPATPNIAERYNYAQSFYNELANKPAAQPVPEESKSESKALKDKLSNETVMHIQSILKAYGYDIGKAGIDGFIGKDTKAALKKFVADLEAV